MVRQIQPELLDTLPATDRGAVGSRRDLRRLNFCMGHARIVARALRAAFPAKPARHLLDLGGGDGDLLLKVCRILGPQWQGVQAVIVDRQNVVSKATLAGFSAAGWKVRVAEHDVVDYLCDHAAPLVEVVLANLVLHHFTDGELEEFFSLIEGSTSLFLAVEPRRSPFGLAFSRAVGLIGCNAVTRHDAPASVLAGFAGNELSRLWPKRELWSVEERPAGLFSHLFLARRMLG